MPIVRRSRRGYEDRGYQNNSAYGIPIDEFQREEDEWNQHPEWKERGGYGDRRTLSGRTGLKPGPKPGHGYGMASVLIALHGIDFPATKQDVIDEFGDQIIEWYKDNPMNVEEILEETDQEEFLNMADLVHAIGEVVKSSADRRKEGVSRRGGRARPDFIERDQRRPSGGYGERRQRISEQYYDEPGYYERGAAKGRKQESRGSSPEQRERELYEQLRRKYERGSYGPGAAYMDDTQGEPGSGGRTRGGAPITESGHIDRRTREGRAIQEMEQGSSRGLTEESEREVYERLRSKYGSPEEDYGYEESQGYSDDYEQIELDPEEWEEFQRWKSQKESAASKRRGGRGRRKSS